MRCSSRSAYRRRASPPRSPGCARSTRFGASVTIPHKLAALALCDEVSPAARAIGAVNCLHIDGARLIGHNTDEAGFIDSLEAAGFAANAPRAVVLGPGAPRARWPTRCAHGAVEVIGAPTRGGDVDRRAAVDSCELRASFARAELVVDCTSLGLGGPDELPVTDALPLDALPPAAWVATLVYHRPTRLLERARQAGHPTVDGRGMLVHQAARAFSIWTGRAAPIDVMTRALDDDLRGT